MIRYWTTWNFSWFLLSKFKKLSFSKPLKLSIIHTSILGLILTNFYIKSILKKKDNLKKKCKRIFKLICFDFVFHQLPLIKIMHKSTSNKHISKYFVLFPVSIWILINKLRHIPLNSIYNTNFKLLVFNVIYVQFILNLLRKRK